MKIQVIYKQLTHGQLLFDAIKFFLGFKRRVLFLHPNFVLFIYKHLFKNKRDILRGRERERHGRIEHPNNCSHFKCLQRPDLAWELRI